MQLKHAFITDDSCNIVLKPQTWAQLQWNVGSYRTLQQICPLSQICRWSIFSSQISQKSCQQCQNRKASRAAPKHSLLFRLEIVFIKTTSQATSTTVRGPRRAAEGAVAIPESDVLGSVARHGAGYHVISFRHLLLLQPPIRHGNGGAVAGVALLGAEGLTAPLVLSDHQVLPVGRHWPRLPLTCRQKLKVQKKNG